MLKCSHLWLVTVASSHCCLVGPAVAAHAWRMLRACPARAPHMPHICSAYVWHVQKMARVHNPWPQGIRPTEASRALGGPTPYCLLSPFYISKIKGFRSYYSL